MVQAMESTYEANLQRNIQNKRKGSILQDLDANIKEKKHKGNNKST